MPSIITHDTFGCELYADLNVTIGQSEDEKRAFLLGCQGPDVFFYGIVNPRTPHANKYAKKLHRSNCTAFLSAFANSVAHLPVNDSEMLSDGTRTPSTREIARAYALGYLMHFELDSSVHPFVFSQQYAYCGAGIKGLDKSSESEVHVEIECELDELVLTVKRSQTISTFDPSTEILKGSDRVLNIAGQMFEESLQKSHGEKAPQNCYRLSVKAYRQVLRWLYSATGVKRELIGRFETLFRQHSYLRAMIHKNVKIETSIFANHGNEKWQDPWVKREFHTESFWDLYSHALKTGKEHIVTYVAIIDSLIDEETSSLSENDEHNIQSEVFNEVLEITQNKNFYGCNEAIANPVTGKPRFRD